MEDLNAVAGSDCKQRIYGKFWLAKINDRG